MTESSRHRTERPKLLLELSLWVTAEVGGAGRLSCISLQQPLECSLPALAPCSGCQPRPAISEGREDIYSPCAEKGRLREKGKARVPESFSALVGWPQTGFCTHPIPGCHLLPHFLPPQRDPGLGKSGPKT